MRSFCRVFVESKIMPATRTVEPRREIYQIRATLLGTEPPIWRRLLVPAEMTLQRLHDVLQRSMGWQDYHLHEFKIGRQRFGTRDPMERLHGTVTVFSERTHHLFEVLGTARKALYNYDFGDDWQLEVVVEKRIAPEPGWDYPACIAGERKAPPEDCGGVFGFYNLLEAINDPEHEEHEQLSEWLGGGFDPEAFSVDEVNRRLAGLQRARKRRAAEE